ncbi:hypothetical protein EAO71_08865, partial [Streptomyces sp. ms191]
MRLREPERRRRPARSGVPVPSGGSAGPRPHGGEDVAVRLEREAGHRAYLAGVEVEVEAAGQD